jgi:thymidylate synthase (FAD)
VSEEANTPDVRFRSDMTVELVKCSASDADVLFAARVSTQGERSKASIDSDASEAAGLIRFLMRERHGSPFEHSVLTFYVRAPIFVWREHMRHRMASYNEESGRYRVLEPEFYTPAPERPLVQVGKPGAYEFVDGTAEQQDAVSQAVRRATTQAYAEYERMLGAGVAREVARVVLPVSIYSSAYVTMNSRALMNFLSLRRRSDDSRFPSYPQREIEMVAERYEELWADVMPLTHQAFVDNGRVAP